MSSHDDTTATVSAKLSLGVTTMGYQLLVTLERTDEGVIATCDELNAVASGATEEEALANLHQAINALLQTYGDEIRERLRERTLKVVEVY